MAQFRSKEKKTPPAISTQSLPDIIFMLIFFFMVSTTMRESTLLVKKTTLATCYRTCYVGKEIACEQYLYFRAKSSVSEIVWYSASYST